MKFYHLYFLVASCFLVTNCCNWEPHTIVHFRVNPEGFTEAQLIQINEAIHDWDVALDGYLEFDYLPNHNHYDYDNMITIEATTSKYLTEKYNEDRVGNTTYVPWKCGGDVQIANDLSDKDIYRVTKHEIGHGFGLGHVKTKGDAMYPFANHERDYMICNDVKQFCALYECDASTFPICSGG